ncbi:MAG: peptidylprolyl isomerase, partial [Gemmatimonadota bacterium]
MRRRTLRKCLLVFVAAIVVFVGAGCSGGAPPQTTPSAGGSEAPPAQPSRDPAPDAAAADAAAADAADTQASSAATAIPVVPISDAAAAEQGPGFALPSVPGTPTAAMPPPADSVELIDRLVAIVGDTAILLSEVREQLFQLQAQGLEMPNDPRGIDSLANATLQRMVEEMMIVQQAEFAGIEVTEEELDDEVDRRFSTIRSRFSSDQEMLDRVEASGQNMFQFRKLLRSQGRKDLLGQRYMRSRLAEMPPIRVTEQEIQAEFNRSATGTTRPATLSMVQILIEPKPAEAARDSALQLAQTALEELRSGEDFDVVARRYSDDEGSRAEGGDLGWIRRSEVLPAFGDAAWLIRL